MVGEFGGESDSAGVRQKDPANPTLGKGVYGCPVDTSTRQSPTTWLRISQASGIFGTQNRKPYKPLLATNFTSRHANQVGRNPKLRYQLENRPVMAHFRERAVENEGANPRG